eukprot:Gb_29940 [translate_table: standard]
MIILDDISEILEKDKTIEAEIIKEPLNLETYDTKIVTWATYLQTCVKRCEEVVKAWVADLVNLPSEYRVGEKWSLVHRTKKWIAKNAPRCQNQGFLVREVAWEAWESKHSTEALKFYKEFKLEGSREFYKRAMRYEDVTPEKVCLLILTRVGGCLLVKRAVRLGLVDHRIGGRCLLCNEEGGDSLLHVLVKCLSLVHSRSRIECLESLVSMLRLTNAANDAKSRLGLLLDGEIGIRLCNCVQPRPTGLGSVRRWVSTLPSRGAFGKRSTFEEKLEGLGPTFYQGTQWSRIHRATGTKSESSWPVCILQAMLEHGSLISSGSAFEP